MKVKHIVFCCSLILFSQYMMSCQSEKKTQEKNKQEDSGQPVVTSDTSIAESERKQVITKTEEPAPASDVAVFDNANFNLQFTYPTSFSSAQELSSVGLNGEVTSSEMLLTDSISNDQIRIKYYPEKQALKVFNILKSKDEYEQVKTEFSENTLMKNEKRLVDGKGNPLSKPIIVKSIYFLSKDGTQLFEMQFSSQNPDSEFIDSTIKYINPITK